jgi:hypothetical protein
VEDDMNFSILPDEMLETIHAALSEANNEAHKTGVDDGPEWKEWRDTVEGEMSKRGLELEHIVLAGEEEASDDGDVEKEKTTTRCLLFRHAVLTGIGYGFRVCLLGRWGRSTSRGRPHFILNHFVSMAMRLESS